MKSAVIKCAGDQFKRGIPTKQLIDITLRKFLEGKGWKIVGFAFIDGIASFLLIKGLSKEGLEESIAEFMDLLKNGWFDGSPNYQKALEMFPETKALGPTDQYRLSLLGWNIAIEVLTDSTETDSQIFAQFVLRAQLEAVADQVNDAKEELEGIRDMFKEP